MIDLIQRYYAGEKQTALMGIAIGVAVVLVAGVLWRTSASGTLARGMAYALIAFGVLQSAASGSYSAIVSRRAAAAVESVAGRPEATVAQQEVARMRGVLASGFNGPLAFNTLLIIVGLVLVFASQGAPARKGVALALMIAGVVGHCFEAFSMQRNRAYLAQVEARIS